jgi:apolipoprotein N-acyltransferase
VAIICGLYGIWRIDQINSLSKEASALKVGIAQGNIPQELKWNPKFQKKTLDNYLDLTKKIAKTRPDLVVWPETSAPFYFQSDRKYSPMLLDAVRDTGVELLFGSPAYKRKGKEIELFNRAYLISDGETRGYYDKVHLVPFGEYVPLRRLLPFLKRMVESVGDFSPGEDTTPILLKGKIPFGVLICFESIFPELSRSFARKGARFIVNITNDAWYGYSSAPYQHLSMLTLRAVENRVSIARSANTGISAVVDATGRIKAKTGLFKREIIIDKISILPIKSFYTRYGDLFSYLCLGMTILLLFFSLLRTGPVVGGAKTQT